jgi:hypothetical protein
VDVLFIFNSIFAQVLFASFKGAVRDALKTGGFYEHVPKQRLFPTVNDAVTFAQNKMQMSPISATGRKAHDSEQQHRLSEIAGESAI